MNAKRKLSREAPSTSQAITASVFPDQPSPLQPHVVFHFIANVLHFIAELALSVSYCTFIFPDQFHFDYPCL